MIEKYMAYEFINMVMKTLWNICVMVMWQWLCDYYRICLCVDCGLWFSRYVSCHFVYIKHKKLKVKKLKGTKVKETKVKKLKGEKVKKVNETSVKGTYDIVYKGKVEKGEELEPKGKGTSGG
eukprot:525252_1